MKNKEKKVIILDNLSSPFIAQAIIILKENAPEGNCSIIREAEQIVAGYFPMAKKAPVLKKQTIFKAGVLAAAFLALTAFLIKFC